MSTSKHTDRCIEKHDFDECFEIASLCICEEAETLLTEAQQQQAYVAELFVIAKEVYAAVPVPEAKL
jgi:hypothetical protein